MRSYTFLKILLAITCGFILGILSAVAQCYNAVPLSGILQWGIIWIIGAYFLSRLGRDALVSALIGALFLLLAVFGYLWALDLLGGQSFSWSILPQWVLTAAIVGGALGLLSTFGGIKSAGGCAAQSVIPSIFLAIALYCLFNLVRYMDSLGFIGLMLLLAILLHAAVYGRYAGSSRSMLATLALAVLWLIIYGAAFLFIR